MTVLRLPSRKAPQFLWGWAWFLGPSSGDRHPQVGLQSHADRYTYIPSIGILVAVRGSWASPGRQWLPGILLARPRVAIPTLGVAAVAQVQHWRSSETLCAVRSR